MIKWLKSKFKKKPKDGFVEHFENNPLPKGFDTKSPEAYADPDDGEPKVHVVPTYYAEDGSVNDNFESNND